MRAYDVIYKKRNGQKLSKEEISFMIEGYTKHEIADYQMSAFLMSVYFQNLDDEETFYLTNAMAKPRRAQYKTVNQLLKESPLVGSTKLGLNFIA